MKKQYKIVFLSGVEFFVPEKFNHFVEMGSFTRDSLTDGHCALVDNLGNVTEHIYINPKNILYILDVSKVDMPMRTTLESIIYETGNNK